jgi:hypothetical protein
VAEADAEQRLAGVEQLADHWHRIVARGGGIAGAVGEEDAVGRERHDLVEGRGRRHHRNLRPGLNEVAEDVELTAVIHCDHVRPRTLASALIAEAEPPDAALPTAVRLARHVLGEVHPLQPGPAARQLEQQVEVELAVGCVRHHPVRRAAAADAPRQRARVDPCQPDARMPLHPSGEILHRTEVARRGRVLAHDHAERVRVVGLDVVGIGADIADMREGEGDDLPGEARVGHDLLITRHGGVEAHLAHRLPRRAESSSPCHLAAGEDEDARRSIRSGRVRKRGVGHGRRALLVWVGNVAKPRPLETRAGRVNRLRTQV